MLRTASGLLWDVFCHVIDNWGDVGVCWRLACNLADRGQRVRLWLDEPQALTWMAPGGHARVTVLPWIWANQADRLASLPAADVWIEAFGCEIPSAFVARFAADLRARPPTVGGSAPWFNLEYLSAERHAARNHTLHSPVWHGPGAGLSKMFFYPGFTGDTGGLMREPDLLARQARFDPARWLNANALPAGGVRRVSLFCYEPAGLPDLLRALVIDGVPTQLLVTPGHAPLALQMAVDTLGWTGLPASPAPGQCVEITPRRSRDARRSLQVLYLPAMPQTDFDHLLWACDLNLIRGEDSLVRALWAGRPLLWQLYPQSDGAHQPKLEAWLNWLQADASLRDWHRRWNGMAATSNLPLGPLPWSSWQVSLRAARQRLLDGPELVTQLLAQVGQSRPQGLSTEGAS